MLELKKLLAAVVILSLAGLPFAYAEQVVWQEPFTGTAGTDLTGLGWTNKGGTATMQVSDLTIDQGQSGKSILSGANSTLYYSKPVNYTVGSTYANEDVEIRWVLSKNGADVAAEFALYIDSSDGVTNLLDWQFNDIVGRRMFASQMNSTDPSRDYYTGAGALTACEMKMVALHGQIPTFWYNTAIGSNDWTQIPVQTTGWAGEALTDISQIRLWVRGESDSFPLYVDSIKITVSGQPLPPPGQVVWQEPFTGTAGTDLTGLGWTNKGGAATMQVSDLTINQGQSGKAILSGSNSNLYYSKPVNYTVGSTYANEDVEIRWALSKNGQDVAAEFCLYIDSSDGSFSLLDWAFNGFVGHRISANQYNASGTSNDYYTGIGGFTACEMKMVAPHGQTPTFWYNTAIGSNDWIQIPSQYTGWSGEALTDISQIRLWVRGESDSFPLYVDSIKITVSGQPLPPPGQVVWQEPFTGTTGSDLTSLGWTFVSGAATMQVSDQIINQGQSGKAILSGASSVLYYKKPVNYTVGSTYGTDENVVVQWALSKNGADVAAEFALYIDSSDGVTNLLDWQFNGIVGHRMYVSQMNPTDPSRDYYTGISGFTACEIKMVARYGKLPTYWYNTAIGSNNWIQIPLVTAGWSGKALSDISQIRLWVRGDSDSYPLYVDSIKVTVNNAPDTTCATPVFSPDGGAWAAPVDVSISCATPETTIHYTLDGTNPTQDSPTYGGTPITISDNTTLKAQAWANGHDPSVIATAKYSFPVVALNRPNPINTGTATIDGDLADWTDVTWAPLDRNYFGSPYTILEASYAAKWDPSGTRLYVAVRVQDTSPYLADEFMGWYSQSDVEIYLHTNGSYPNNSTNYQVDQGAAQQYAVGIATDNVTAWSVIASPSAAGYQAIPAAANFQAAGRRVGEWLSYEVAITPFKVFDLTGANMVASSLYPNQIIGLDVIASDMYGMKSENPMTGKFGDYSKFGLHSLTGTLVPIPTPTPTAAPTPTPIVTPTPTPVPLPGDANGDHHVTFADFAILQNYYGQSGMGWNQGDFNGDGRVTFEDFSILQNHYGQSQAGSPAAAENAAATTPCSLLGVILLAVLTVGLLALKNQD